MLEPMMPPTFVANFLPVIMALRSGIIEHNRFLISERVRGIAEILENLGADKSKITKIDGLAHGSGMIVFKYPQIP
jgi:hypothetical protein